MRYCLPYLTEKIPFFPQGKRLLAAKTSRYKLAALLDLILIIAILLSAKAPVQRLVSPLGPGFNSFYSAIQKPIIRESFAFVPDLAPNRFNKIDLEHLTYLSFFDIPVAEDGRLRLNSRGYASFTSENTAALFDKARYQRNKLFLTVSALDALVIESILENPEAQYTLADQVISEITNSNLNGITLDFEFPEGKGRNYQQRFTNFVSLLNNRMRAALPETELAVAIPSNLIDNQSIYNIEELSKISDKIFLIASNFIVPETKDSSYINPVFGTNPDEYWSGISKMISSLHKRVPQNKLVVERAWYGNGNNYPLYIPSRIIDPTKERQTTAAALDGEILNRLVAGVPPKGQEAARRNIPIITQALNNEGILDTNVLAYALATVEHETDETFEPIAEIQGSVNARRFGYEGGANYFGRGFIQITHLRNYQRFGERIGMGDRLVKNPEMASDPDIAAKILAAFFKDNNVANLASRGNFVAARTPVNPDYNGYAIANIAMKYDIQQ